MEGLGRIAEAKWHGEKFIEAKRSDNSGFGNVRRMNRNLVIAFYQIQRGEDRGAMEAGREILEIGEGVAVRNSGQV